MIYNFKNIANDPQIALKALRTGDEGEIDSKGGPFSDSFVVGVGA